MTRRHYTRSHFLSIHAFAALFLCAAFILTAMPDATAELQQVSVGGELRMRYRYYHNTFEDGRRQRIPNAYLPKRPLGPNGVSSIFKWDDERPDRHFLETSVLLNVKADFTENVSAYFELYDFWVWGEDFRSDYITGGDFRANSGDDVEINQAYIETRDTFGLPLRLRIGRQELCLGKGWLVCNMLTPTQHLSYDAVRATYATDIFSVDAFAAKLNESGVAEEDGDVDLYGVYATYYGLEYVDLAAYWFLVRDARSLNDTNFVWALEWLEDLFNIDDYDVTNLHTVGIRVNGQYEAWDYDLELAYQFGDAGAHGVGFVPNGLLYGDDDAQYDNWGAELTVGYTLDQVAWSPRIWVQGVYFEGEDNRDINFWDWMNPFYQPDASVSFNRLFSASNYLPVVNDNGWLSNYYSVSANLDLHPTEKIKLHFHLAKGWIDKPFDRPVSFEIGDFSIPIAPAFSFWTEEGSDDLGWEATAYLKYNYTEDVSILFYYNHLFAGDGLTDGSFIQFNGTDYSGGSGDEDADYFFWMLVMKF